MVGLVKCALFEYYIIFMKMALDPPKIPSTRFFFFLTNVKTLLMLNVVVPLLEIIHSLIKLHKIKGSFIYYFITKVKICEGDVNHMYCNIRSSSKGDVSINFTTLINIIHNFFVRLHI